MNLEKVCVDCQQWWWIGLDSMGHSQEEKRRPSKRAPPPFYSHTTLPIVIVPAFINSMDCSCQVLVSTQVYYSYIRTISYSSKKKKISSPKHKFTQLLLPTNFLDAKPVQHSTYSSSCLMKSWQSFCPFQIMHQREKSLTAETYPKKEEVLSISI